MRASDPSSNGRVGDVPLTPDMAVFAELASRVDDPVLLLGETGSGKSLYARLLHERSRRAGRALVAANCAALPESLFEREVFGHVAGAFTDARAASPGLFEAASGGTLVLDEVAELSPTSQAKLLHAVDAKRIRRLGSAVEVDLDVRLISCTNADIDALVQHGTFRLDLFFRLAGLTFTLPRLSERADFDGVVNYVLRAIHGEAATLSEEVLALLRSYPWPGNIREMESLLRAASHAGNGQVTPEQIARLLRESAARARHTGTSTRASVPVTADAIRQALAHSDGNRTRAARALGISRSTLWTKLRMMERRPSHGPDAVRLRDPIRPGSRAPFAPSSTAPARAGFVARGPRGTGGVSRRRQIAGDLQDAWRAIRRRPGSSAAAVAVAALGIGLATTLFAFADPVLLRPLPYPQAERLVMLRPTVRRDRQAATAPPGGQSAWPLVSDWQARGDLFEDVAGSEPLSDTRLRLPQGAVVLNTFGATESFFEVLGAHVPLWRSALSDRDPLPLFLTEAAFRRVFGASQDVIGRTFDTDDGRRVRITAVLPDDLLLPNSYTYHAPDALTPVSADFPFPSAGSVVARLRPGITAPIARGALQASSGSNITVNVVPLREFLARGTQSAAVAALVWAALILVVCAASTASLLLARTVSREQEFQTRRHLGAGPADLLRLVGLEGLIVFVASTCVALVLASAALAWAGQLLPAEYVAIGRPLLSARAVIAGVITGVVLLLAAVVPSVLALIRPRVGPTPTAARLRPLLAAGQSTLATALLLCALVLNRSHELLMSRDTGFSSDVQVAEVSYPQSRSGARLEQEVEATAAQLRYVPGVTAAAAATGPFVDHTRALGYMAIGGQPVLVVPRYVTTSYFSATGARVLEGRPLTSSDEGSGAVVISETLAREVWPEQSALGRVLGGSGQYHVVGVVQDMLDLSLDQTPEPTVFWPLEGAGIGSSNSPEKVTYLLRGADSRVHGVIRRAVTDGDPDAVLVNVSSLGDRFVQSAAVESLGTLVASLFAGTSLVLALGGLTGVMAFAVARRRREIAIRCALGAAPRHVVRLVGAEALGATLVGVIAGLALGRVGSQLLEHLLFGIRPGDPLSITVACGAILVFSLCAVAVPLRRALLISPAESLKPKEN